MTDGATGVVKFTAGTEDGSDGGFAAWCDAISPLFEVAPNGRGTAPSREGQLSLWSMTPTVLGACQSGGHRFARRRGTIARGGLDHLLVQLLIEGEDALLAGAEENLCRPGDIRIADLARPIETATGPYRNLTLIVPREMVEPGPAMEDRLHGRVLRREDPTTRLLSDHLRGMLDVADDLPEAAAGFAQASVGLLTSCLAGAASRTQDLAWIADGARSAIQAYIARNLTSPSLTLDEISRRFGLSRSSIYRLFEPIGGVAGHIRRQRLRRAWRRLTTSALPVRVALLARECGFSSADVFSRAFRERYGMSPREAWASAKAAPDPAGKILQRWLKQV